ncbi:MAG: ATP-binding cassette domain-containing protein [Bacilli bacterium]|nr:ATP-binding cassette domain-containing protein [Bacilli bacterium]
MSVLVCDNITKIYKDHNSIKNFSFNFLDNQIYAIIGRSDSGKDTLLQLMTAKIKPNDGFVYLDGDILQGNSKILSRLCYIPAKTTFPDYMSVKGILKEMKSKFPKWDNYYAYQLLEHFNIKPNSSFSSLLVNKQSLLFNIIALSSRANITFLDDAISNIDIKDRYDFFHFLYVHHETYPRTIIIATEYVDEIDYIFHKILFLDKGHLIDYFTTEEVKSNFCYLSGKTEVLKSLINGIKVIGVEDRGKMLTVCIRKKLNKDEIRKFQKYLIKISEVPIQKIFIYLIKLRELKEKKVDQA